MAKRNITNNNGIWWKTVIVLTFILSMSCLGILINNRSPEEKLPEYETRIIKLDNTIFISNENVVDYLCDEGVSVVHFPSSNFFSASTWEGSDRVKPQYRGMNGKCMIKIRYRVE